jgi:hypothetical protein
VQPHRHIVATHTKKKSLPEQPAAEMRKELDDREKAERQAASSSRGVRNNSRRASASAKWRHAAARKPEPAKAPVGVQISGE